MCVCFMESLNIIYRLSPSFNGIDTTPKIMVGSTNNVGTMDSNMSGKRGRTKNLKLQMTQGSPKTKKLQESSQLQGVYIQGQLVNSKTLKTISIPVGICHTKSRTFNAFNAMWRFLAVSFPFCIAGTRAAAAAHSTVMAVHINYTSKIRIDIPQMHNSDELNE